MTTPLTYEDVTAAATVGVHQRPVPVTALAGPAAAHAAVLDTSDQAAAVLGAAALLTAARRAGVRTAAIGALPAAAAADSTPELSPAASAVLTFALDSKDPELLAGLLTATAAAGYRAAPPLLPALLDAATASRRLRPAVASVLGERGRWLAAHRADWQRAADADVADIADDPVVWETGSRGERRGWLAALRRRDPDDARAVLAAGWSRETGHVRAELLAVLTEHLSEADEPFLEAALEDRKSSVRQTAATLLAAIPASAFNTRASGRAAGILRVERRGLRRTLAVTLPDSCDAAARRDGISPAPPAAGIGAGAWLLTQFVAAVPLPEWTGWCGLDAATLVQLPVQGGFRADVHAGWRLAAVRRRDATWATALLAADKDSVRGRPPLAWPAAAELAAVLPASERVARAVALLAADGASAEAAAAVVDCPGPWPGLLADAVLCHVAGLIRGAGQRPDPLIEGVLSQLASPAWAAGPRRELDPILRAAAARLPADGRRDFAAELRALAAPGAGGLWTVDLLRTADTIDRRRLFLEELQ